PGLGLKVAICFLLGALFSISAGYIGMRVATKANVRTANAAMESGMNKALSVAFSGGAVMGMCVVGLGHLGVGQLYIIYGDPNIITGFGLGASSIALFARVGGGIYTKAADVGADLVGKVEAGIPEDDCRNPAVIADNVGDNVGDVAGMGADLYESYVGSLLSAMALGVAAGLELYGALIPLSIAAFGVVCSIIGTFFVRTKENVSQKSLLRALRAGTWFAAAATAAASALFLWRIGYARVILPVLIGLAAGVL